MPRPEIAPITESLCGGVSPAGDEVSSPMKNASQKGTPLIPTLSPRGSRAARKLLLRKAAIDVPSSWLGICMVSLLRVYVGFRVLHLTGGRFCI